MNSDILKNYCKEKLCLDLVGICDVNYYYDLENIIKNRIKNNYLTGMEESIIENRVNPKNILETAKSIIVIAFPYYIGEFEESNLSKYCISNDYHIVTKNIMQKICDFLSSKINNFEYKYYSDTGPLVDRYLAYLSGIGYFGINNNIITDKYGSYVFLGYIINNFNFEKDTPLNKTCLKCGKCIISCPSSSILGNFEMNPKRCLSYLTQKKEELTEEEKTLIKDNKKVFGCDICQEVCPHNKNIEKTSIKEFTENILTRLELEEISNISNKEFKRRYLDKAFSWRGKKIINRNLEIINGKISEGEQDE